MHIGPFDVEHLAGINSNGDLLVFFWTPRDDWQVVNLSVMTGPELQAVSYFTNWQTSLGRVNIENIAGIVNLPGSGGRNRLLVYSWSPDGIRTIHIQAIQASDTNMANLAHINPAQVEQWVDKANMVYSKAGIQFLFNSNPNNPRGSDWSTPINDPDNLWKNDLINNHLVCGNDRQASSAGDFANQHISTRFPTKAVIIFRFGGDGCGYSGGNANFMSMPGFFDTGGCGRQNIDLFAHELGHYMGLDHTHKNEFSSIGEAERYFIDPTRGNSNPIRAFDGDFPRVTDTPPDPLIDELACHPPPVITLDGTWLDISGVTNNIMSYWGAGAVTIKTVSLQQAIIAQQTLEQRAQQFGLLIGKP
jgi:Metallo-peptidase family M12B Reprolysin-like